MPELEDAELDRLELRVVAEAARVLLEAGERLEEHIAGPVDRLGEAGFGADQGGTGRALRAAERALRLLEPDAAAWTEAP